MWGTVDDLWTRLAPLTPIWVETTAAVAALLLAILIRQVVGADARHRTRTSILLLLIGLGLRITAESLAGGAGSAMASGIGLAAILCLVVGIVNLAGIVVFDLVFVRTPMPAVVRDLAQALVVAGILITVLYRHGIDPVPMVATGGVLTAIIGFALQSTIANVFAGIALPLERQLAIGDWIEAGGHIGRIREIKWRSTTIVSKDGDTIIVPNNQLITTNVTNFSRPTVTPRANIRVTLHGRHPPNDVRVVLLNAVRGAPGVLDEPEPDCFPVDFPENGVTYRLRIWYDDFFHSEQIEGEVRSRVWYAARRAGLEMPTTMLTVVAAAHVGDDPRARRTEALARVDLFATLDGELRNHLIDALQEQSFGAGEDIIREGAPGDSLFVVDRGAVVVRVSLDRAHREVARLGPGDFFGEMSLMTGEPRHATCRAIMDTACYVIDRAAMRAVFDARPRFADEISTILAERLVELEASRDGLGADARARRRSDTHSRILSAIRNVFGL
jgi:small-conductance mechanosensitive channel/CRP-like cAMP-binding protein